MIREGRHNLSARENKNWIHSKTANTWEWLSKVNNHQSSWYFLFSRFQFDRRTDDVLCFQVKTIDKPQNLDQRSRIWKSAGIIPPGLGAKIWIHYWLYNPRYLTNMDTHYNTNSKTKKNFILSTNYASHDLITVKR